VVAVFIADGDSSVVFMWVTVYSLQRLIIYTYSRGLGYDHLPVCRVQLTSFSYALLLSPEAKVRLEAVETRGMWRPPRRLD
jgi:hypothetical protein